MNAFEATLEDLNKTQVEFLEDGLKPLDILLKDVHNYFARLHDVIAEYQETRTVPRAEDFANWEEVAKRKPRGIPSARNSLKENVKPVKTKTEKPDSPPRSRPRRNAFREASANLNKQTSMSSNTKLRRDENLSTLQVKVEKLSISPADNKTLINSNSDDITIKMENNEMLAPNRPAPRKKKRKETIKVKEEKIRDSDVILQDATVTIINLDDLDEGEKTLTNEKSQKKMKRSRSESAEKKNTNEKKSKSNDNQSEYLDAVSIVETNNATFVTQPPNTLNVTVTVENPKLKILVPNTVEDMMTDDESEEEVPKKKNPVKPVRAIPKPIKPVFSPFEQSPVKKKVQAFEKLNEANTMPTRTTRTKTRALAKEQEQEDEEETERNNVKEKAKIFTPVAPRFTPKATSTTTKSNRVLPTSSNESLLSAKSASALKASQTEYREREKKRREKEQDALKKREALLQAQIEEKRRKREEKQLKAQHQREQLEKEKLKSLDVQRQKDERHRQIVQEQEEKKMKMREEHEKKRMLAKMRAVEEKKREEEKRIEEERKAEEMTAKLAKRDGDYANMLKQRKQRPIYMTNPAPRLPTGDCYDSDEEEAARPYTPPEWNREQNMKLMQRCAFAVGEAIKNSFFSIQAQTIDLQDVFEGIEPQKLKRTSSAVWTKQPRFTMLPPLENHDETEEFDED